MNRKPEDVEREVRQVREDMDPVLRELDLRRHELTDWRLQLRRHGPILAKAGAVVVGVFVAAGVAKDVGRTLRRRMRRRRVRHGMDDAGPIDARREATM